MSTPAAGAGAPGEPPSGSPPADPAQTPSTYPPEPPKPGNEPGEPSPGTETEGDKRLSDEAAKYRVERNQARDQVAQLQARLDDVDRREVERAVADTLVNPEDLWLTTQLDALRADDGTLDREKVNAAATQAVTARPHWRKPGQSFDQGGGNGGGVVGVPGTEGPASFGQALKDAARG